MEETDDMALHRADARRDASTRAGIPAEQAEPTQPLVAEALWMFWSILFIFVIDVGRLDPKPQKHQLIII